MALAVILAFKVYVGKEDDSNGSAAAVCDELCVNGILTHQQGLVLYTDNYYTSVKLAKLMFEKYGWTIVGTILPTDKKSREDEDIPFLKLSNGVRLGVKRGWFREAVLKLKTTTGKSYYLQYTTWRDKKQVCFLHNMGGPSLAPYCLQTRSLMRMRIFHFSSFEMVRGWE